MRIAVAAETRTGEARVALVPELVGKLTGLGYAVAVEPGAGAGALHPDEDYVAAGAEIVDEPWQDADVVVSVNPLDASVVRRLRAGTATVSFLPVNPSHELVADLRDCGVTSFAMELVPRISRAQSMDALSSQSLVSGYRCAIVAAGLLRRFFPLNMTAAGTVPPAEVVVLGAGVAGLQAIATAKRLGAVVKAYDVRAAAAEEIRSMGAVAIELELETLEGAGGYAREMTEDRAPRQRDLLAPYIAAADALITTAAVPGRQAPLLVTAAMVERMKPGSVVVDLAAESRRQRRGCACRARWCGSATRRSGAAPTCRRRCPARPRRLYAQNVVNLVTLMTAATRTAVRPRLRRRDRRRLLRHPRRRDLARAHPHRPGGRAPHERAVVWLTIFVLSVFVGVEVISKVSSTLHTPLMSGRQRDPRDHPARRDPGHRLRRRPRSRWSSGWWRWCSRPSTWSAGSWSPTGCCRCSRGKKPRQVSATHDLGPARLPRRRRLLHPRPQGPLVARAPPAPATWSARSARCVACVVAVLLRRPRPRRADPGRDRGRYGGRRWSAPAGCR